MQLWGRRVDMSSDDMLCPMGCMSVWRCAWISSACIFVGIIAPSIECATVLWALIVASLAWSVAMLAFEVYLSVATTMGTLLNDVPRKRIPGCYALRVAGAPVDIALFIAVLIAAAVEEGAGCPAKSGTAAGELEPVTTIVLVIAAMGAGVGFLFLFAFSVMWVLAPPIPPVVDESALAGADIATIQRTRSMLETDLKRRHDEALARSAVRWSRCCWLCSRLFAVGTLTRPGISAGTNHRSGRIMAHVNLEIGRDAAVNPTSAINRRNSGKGKPHASAPYLQPPFDAVGSIMAGVFEGVDGLGLTASDLCAGLALVRAVQKDEEREMLAALAEERSAAVQLQAEADKRAAFGPRLAPPPLVPASPTSPQPAPLPGHGMLYRHALPQTSGKSELEMVPPPVHVTGASKEEPLLAPAVHPQRPEGQSLTPTHTSAAARSRGLLRPFLSSPRERLPAGSSAAAPALTSPSPAEAVPGVRRTSHFLPSVHMPSGLGGLPTSVTSMMTSAATSIVTSARELVRTHRQQLVRRRVYAQFLTGTKPLEFTNPADVSALNEAAHFSPYATAAYGFLIAAYMQPLTCLCVLPLKALWYGLSDALGDCCRSRRRWEALWADITVRPHYTHCHGLSRLHRREAGSAVARWWRWLCGRRDRADTAACSDGEDEGMEEAGLARGDVCGCNEAALRHLLKQHLLPMMTEETTREAAPAAGETTTDSAVRPAPAAADVGAAPLGPSLTGDAKADGPPLTSASAPAPVPSTSSAVTAGVVFRSTSLLHTSHTNAFFAMPWYVAHDVSSGSLVVAVRGTLSVDDCLTDALAWPIGGARTKDVHATALLLTSAGVALDPRRCYVHGGMWEAAKGIRDQLISRGLLEAAEPGHGAIPLPASLEARLCRKRRERGEEGSGGKECGPHCSCASTTIAAACTAEGLPSDAPSSASSSSSSSSPPHPRLRLVIVGHSLGAGVASLLSLLLRPHYSSLRCYAISPPGALVSRHLARAMEAWTVSVVVGKDLVPRTSLPSLHRLLDEATDYMGRAKVSKPSIIGSAAVACCASACVPSACYPLCQPANNAAACTASDVDCAPPRTGRLGALCWRLCRPRAATTAVISPTLATVQRFDVQPASQVAAAAAATATPSAAAPAAEVVVAPGSASGAGVRRRILVPSRLTSVDLLYPAGAPLSPQDDTPFARALRASTAARAPLRDALRRQCDAVDAEEGETREAPTDVTEGPIGSRQPALPPAFPAPGRGLGRIRRSLSTASTVSSLGSSEEEGEGAGGESAFPEFYEPRSPVEDRTVELTQLRPQQKELGFPAVANAAPAVSGERETLSPTAASGLPVEHTAVAIELPSSPGVVEDEGPVSDLPTAEEVAQAIAPLPISTQQLSSAEGQALSGAGTGLSAPSRSRRQPLAVNVVATLEAVGVAAPGRLLAATPTTPSAQRRLLRRPMYMPGRILSLVKINVAAVDVPSAACRVVLPGHPLLADRLAALFCCCFRRMRKIYEPRWGRRSGFGRVLVSTDMVADHMPDHAMLSLQAVREDVLGRQRQL